MRHLKRFRGAAAPAGDLKISRPRPPGGAFCRRTSRGHRPDEPSTLEPLGGASTLRAFCVRTTRGPHLELILKSSDPTHSWFSEPDEEEGGRGATVGEVGGLWHQGTWSEKPPGEGAAAETSDELCETCKNPWNRPIRALLQEHRIRFYSAF